LTQTKQYLDLVKYILDNGQFVNDRTGVGTYSCFGLPTMTFDLQQSFPLVTAKKMPWKGTVEELKWFLSGSTNIKDLDKSAQAWWSPWADEDGNLDYMYGEQFRSYGGALGKDQLMGLINSVKRDPSSRRHVVTLWNPNTVDKQPLACCHGTVIQCYVRGPYLDMATYQRSADAFLGLPVNIASYSLLLSLLAKVTGYLPGKLFYTLGDAHVYSNHVTQCQEMISRPLLPEPKLELSNEIKEIGDFSLDKLKLIGYTSHGQIQGELAI